MKSFVSWLETSLDRAAAEHPSPGRVALHRMNRVEYANAVERIFGLHVDASSLLPVDDISDGFDNIASVLKVSPSFLDQYISAARAVTSRALGNPTARPVGLVYRASGADQSSYMEGQPLGTRGGMLIEHTFPADGEYVFDIGNLATGGYVLNMDTKHRVLLTIDGLKVFEASLGGEVDLKAIDQSQPQAAAVEAINARFKKIRIGVKVRHSKSRCDLCGQVCRTIRFRPPALCSRRRYRPHSQDSAATDHRPIRSGRRQRHTKPSTSFHLYATTWRKQH